MGKWIQGSEKRIALKACYPIQARLNSGDDVGWVIIKPNCGPDSDPSLGLTVSELGRLYRKAKSAADKYKPKPAKRKANQ